MDLQRPGDDHSLFRVEPAVGGHQLAQFVRAELFLACSRVAAEDPHGQVGGLAQHPHRRTGQDRQQVERAGHQQRPPLCVLHGQPLGRQLAEHQRDERQHQGDQGDRDRLGRAVEEAQGRHQRFGQRHRRRG